MGLNKVTYQDLVTVIAALNLNDIQDAIIALEGMLPSIAPEYSVNTSYTPGDYVVYQNVLYKCTSATSGAWNPSKWTACNFGDEMQAYEESTDAELRSLFADLVESITTEYSATAMYDVGDIVEKDGLIYRCIVPIITPEAWTASHWTAIDLSNEITSAQRDATEGYSDTLTAGDLTSDEYAEDSEPYLFRRTYGGANNHAMDTLVGGTVAWDQMLKALDSTNWGNESGVTSSYSDGVVTFSSTSSNNGVRTPSVNYTQGHKYLVSVSFKSASDITVSAGGDTQVWVRKSMALTGDSNWHTFSYVESALQTASKYFYMFGVASSYSNLMAQKPMLIDLTQMFGSTIADAVYAMEQAESGSGVAWFRKYFPESYYAYDSGTLKSVEAVAHRMVGFNRWDEEWEVGGINASTGEKASDNYRIRSKNYIPILPNTVYYVKNPIASRSYQYDANKTYLGTDSMGNNSTFTTRADACFMRFSIGSTSNPITTYNHDICINFSDTNRNGQYEPYVQHTYKLSPLTLRGIPKLTDGKLQYDGDTYAPSGQVVRRYGVVDLGSLTWTYISDNSYFRATLSGAYYADAVTSICSKYRVITNSQRYIDKTLFINSNPFVIIKDSDAGTDATAFKTAMNGVYLVYELATPTTETASTYEPTQVVYADGTEEYISQNIVPVGHVTKYPVSIKQALTQIATAPSANGTYILKCTVSGGVASYSWVTE